MNTELISYTYDGLEMEGSITISDIGAAAKPLVLLIHDWTGHREFIQEKAKYFAKQGFNAFAVDLYGKGKRGSDTDKAQNQTLLSELLANRGSISARINAGLDCALQNGNIDQSKIMVLGFCMGGLCALDYARSGANVAGIVSIHGLLHPPEHNSQNAIKAKILVMHGHEDKSVPPDTVLAFEQEMTKRSADWQMHIFGNTYHAFTNPKAQDMVAGLVYDEKANNRTWAIIRSFTDEIFA